MYCGSSQYPAYEQTYKYDAPVLEAVQQATIGSGAVRYNLSPTVEEGNYDKWTEKTEEKSDIKVEEKNPQPNINGSFPDESQQVCRDFSNGRCNRTNCKFKHDMSSCDNGHTKSPVCKDYQKLKCHRTSCKYLHLTQAEEEEYNNTGVVPVTKPVEQTQIDAVVIDMCRDFQKGICTRGPSCKFLHRIVEMGRPLYGKRPYDSTDLSMGVGGDFQHQNETLKQKVVELHQQVLELQRVNAALQKENLEFHNQISADSLSGGEKISLLQN